MSKLAESYVEFVAKGLDQVEAGINHLSSTTQNTALGVQALSAEFANYAVKNKEAIDSTKIQLAVFEQVAHKAKALMVAGIQLAEIQAKLSVAQKTLENSLLKTNSAFQKSANNLVNLASQERLLGVENSSLIAKMQSVDKTAIKLAAAEMKASQATDQATKKLQLEARQLNLISGEFAKASKSAEALAKMEEKIAAKELKIVNKISGKPSSEKESTTDPKKLEQQIKIKTDGGDKAISLIEKIKGKLQGMQMAALIAGGAIAGSVGMLTRAASAGTVEGEQLAKSYEIAGRVIGDIFAPYVRLTTELVGKLTAYWQTLSSGLKSSIAKWAMLTAAAVAFAAALPTIIAGVGAVISLIAAIASPIGLAIAAITALIGYFAGVFDKTKSWEEVLASFIQFFLNTWSRAEDAFEKFCAGVVSNYDATVGPMLELMESGWASVSETIGSVVAEIGELIAGFFGTSIEEATTFQGAMTAVSEAWMDLETAASAVIEMLSDGFMFIYDEAVKPTVELILGAFKSVWDYISEAAKGIFGSWSEATGGISDSISGALKFMFGSWKNFTATVVSLVFTIVETFATAVNKISELWWGMINKLAKGAAWVMEKMGLISKDTADKMRTIGQGNTDIFDTDSMRKKMDGYLDNMVMGMEENKLKAKELGETINEFVNPPAGSPLGDKLDENGRKAKNIAKTIVGMVKTLDKPSGFQIKANMSFEGIGASMERLQLAFANNTGASVDKMQLGEMKAINQNMAIAAGALNQIKDKIPAVR